MTDLPDTRTTPRRGGRAPWIATIVLLGAAAVAVAVVPGGGDTMAPGGELRAAGVVEVSASTGDDPFPRDEASTFPRGTRAVRIALRVEDAPVAGEMFATVERSGRSSALGRIFGGSGVVAEDGGEGRLTVSADRVSGVVSFVVRGTDGGALPGGGYEVEVRFDAEENTDGGRLAARKYFWIGDPQT